MLTVPGLNYHLRGLIAPRSDEIIFLLIPGV